MLQRPWAAMRKILVLVGECYRLCCRAKGVLAWGITFRPPVACGARARMQGAVR